VNSKNIQNAWPILQRQVKKLDLPWLEAMVLYQDQTRDPFKILISCILSLRTQDRTTGEASERLFSIAPDVASLAKLPLKKIEKSIYPVGFYKVKAQRIKELAHVLIQDYKSEVPDEIEELLKLKGVGRKTANLVVTLGYNKYGICVDTHVHRITNRWGYVKTESPDKTEFALREKLPKKYWKAMNGLLVAFGQGICKPVSPFCTQCMIHKFCDRVGVEKHR
jgi:endonuclease-3